MRLLRFEILRIKHPSLPVTVCVTFESPNWSALYANTCAYFVPFPYFVTPQIIMYNGCTTSPSTYHPCIPLVSAVACHRQCHLHPVTRLLSSSSPYELWWILILLWRFFCPWVEHQWIDGALSDFMVLLDIIYKRCCLMRVRKG